MLLERGAGNELLKQTEFAKRIGVTPSTVSIWVKKQNLPVEPRAGTNMVDIPYRDALLFLYTLKDGTEWRPQIAATTPTQEEKSSDGNIIGASSTQTRAAEIKLFVSKEQYFKMWMANELAAGRHVELESVVDMLSGILAVAKQSLLGLEGRISNKAVTIAVTESSPEEAIPLVAELVKEEINHVIRQLAKITNTQQYINSQ